MGWAKHVLHGKFVAFLTLFMIIAGIFGLAINNFVIIFICLLYSILFVLNYIYDETSTDHFEFQIESKQKRFFIGETNNFVLRIDSGNWPIINGKLEITFNDKFVNEWEDEGVVNKSEIVTIPLTIKRKSTQRITIPIKANKRGVGRVIQISLIYPNLFGLSKIKLEGIGLWKEEYLVLPKIMPLKMEEFAQLLKESEQMSTYSLYENRLLTIGTRDYVPTDSFKHIHWKASAKLNRLQTKEFEKTNDASILVMLNVAEGIWWNQDLERLISHIAYIAKIAYEQDFPITFATNIRSFTEYPFFYLPAGTGKAQFEKILEMLAIIDTHQQIMPYEEMCAYLLRQNISSATLIHAGILTEQTQKLLSALQDGRSIFILSVGEGNAMVKKLA